MLPGRELGAPLASSLSLEHAVEEVDPLLVAAEDPRLHRKRLSPRHLAEVPDMGLDGVEAPPRRHVRVVRPDEAQQRVRRVPEHLEIAALGHVVVVVDPVGCDAVRVEREGAREIMGLGARGAMGAGVELRLVGAKDGPCPVVVGAEPLHDGHQAVVPKPGELANGAPRSLRVGLLGDAVRERCGQLRPFDARPGKRNGRPELLQEVAHPRLAARETAEQEGAHDAPAKAGAEGDRLVDLRGGGDPVVHEMERLAPHRFEETVGDEGVDLRVEGERMHPDRPVEGGGPFLRFPGRGLPAHHLDEGQQVDGDERVAHHDPLRPGASPPRARARSPE